MQQSNINSKMLGHRSRNLNSHSRVKRVYHQIISNPQLAKVVHSPLIDYYSLMAIMAVISSPPLSTKQKNNPPLMVSLPKTISRTPPVSLLDPVQASVTPLIIKKQMGIILLN